MIQRIQSIFWLLSIILLSVFAFSFVISANNVFIVYSLLGFSILLNIGAIFSYKNRKRQVLVSILAMLGIIGVLLLQGKLFTSLTPTILLLGSVSMNSLANVFTRKDMKLVEESNRLR